jgi:hypothetical protein
VSEGFKNPIIGGGGTLVYPQIKSPNFNLAAKTGWAILKNGNAYFFGLVTTIGSQLIFINSNTFTGSAAYLFATPAASTSTQSTLFIVGPTDNPALQAILELVGESQDGTKLPFANLFAFNVTTQLPAGGVPLWLGNLAAVPAVPGGITGAGLFASSGQLDYVSSADGNVYDTGRLTLRLATTFTINNNVTPQVIFSKALAVGTYEIDIWLVTQNATAADAAQYAFSGTGGLVIGTGSLVDYESLTGTAATTEQYGASATYTTAFSGQGVGGNQRLLVHATLVVTTAGTLNFTGKLLVAANNVTVSAGSRMRISPVVAT